MLYQIVFSPTGGTKKIADTVTEKFSEDVKKIDLFSGEGLSERLDERDLAIIAVPSYGGRIPAFASKRLEKIHGNGCKAILIAVYGNRDYDDTLIELYDIASKNRFVCIAAITAVAEHSLVKCVATGRPDDIDKKKLKNFADKIVCKLKYLKDVNVPGNRPYVPLKKSFSAKPILKGKCIKCGKCAYECPVSAISLKDVSVVDTEKCISCMHCVSICPKNARTLENGVEMKVREKLTKICVERKEPELFINTTD